MSVKTENTDTGISEFDKLINEIGDVHKSMATDDTGSDEEKIADASGDNDADADVDADTDDTDADNGEVTKSFEVELADGSKAQAYDATDLLKSLVGRVEKNETTVAGALGQMLDIVKSMQGQITKLSAAGKGRKAILSVHEKPVEDINKSQAEENTISVDAFMAKALTAQTEGRISSLDVSKCESYLNRGQQIPADIVKRVMGQ